ncbi:hypothetical protein [Photobacterium sp. 53610]|uniref:hypothetical protein n=1 Tax=Photobacterium sp. 53610 TaxID=3102789 RepID=UPI002EDA9CF6
MKKRKTLLVAAMGLVMSGCALVGLQADKNSGVLALYMDIDSEANHSLPCRAIAFRMKKVTDENGTEDIWSAESYFDIENQAAIITGIADGKYVIDNMRCFAKTRHVFNNFAQYLDIPTFDIVNIYQGKVTLSSKAFKAGQSLDKEKRVYVQLTDAGSLKQDKLADVLRANPSLAGWELIKD